MKLKRILSGIIGLPIVALILIYGNTYVIDILFAIVAAIAIHEYFNSFKENNKPVKWIGYVSCILIAFLHIIPMKYLLIILGLSIPTIIAFLFIKVVTSNMKTSITDIMITFFRNMLCSIFLSIYSFTTRNTKWKILNMVYTNCSLGYRYMRIFCWM